MIRLAHKQDLPFIMEIIHQASRRLKQQNIHQWQDGYPNDEVILNDMKLNQCYVYVEKQVLGVMVCTFNKDENYDVIQGEWLNDDKPYAVIHRIAVHEDHLREHIGKKLFDHAVSLCKQRNIEYLRIDTHLQNLIMQKFIEKQGFHQSGIIWIKREKIEPERYVYEKKIELN